MKVERTELGDVLELTPVRHGDGRGWFSETWNSQTHAAANINHEWVQDNESFSADLDTVRGIHFQTPPNAQDKLVRVLRGRVFDVAVDLRRDSPTFKQWVGRELTAELGNQLLIPKGFGHAFATLVRDTHISYKVTAPYDPASDCALAWNDPDIAIKWPAFVEGPTLSDRDQAAPLLSDLTDRLF